MTKINPIILTDTETGSVYTLEFNRASVRFAEMNGFNIDRLIEQHDKLMTDIPDLFFYAFRMHHRAITHEKTDSILFDELGGITSDMLTRLIELYHVPFNTLVRSEDEEDGESKNAKMTITL